MFQIGTGYFGLSAGSVKLTKADRERAKSAFVRAFSIPMEELKVVTKTKPLAPANAAPAPLVVNKK
jgi:hypothetical protein